MNIIIGLILGLVFFIVAIQAYILGLKHGKQLSNSNIPQSPIKTITEAVIKHEDNKSVNKLEETLTDIMDYSKESALEAIKRGD